MKRAFRCFNDSNQCDGSSDAGQTAASGASEGKNVCASSFKCHLTSVGRSNDLQKEWQKAAGARGAVPNRPPEASSQRSKGEAAAGP